MFPELPAAIFFSIFPTLVGLLAFEDAIKMLINLFGGQMKSLGEGAETAMEDIVDLSWDWIDRRSAEIEKIVVFCTKILKFDLDARKWNLSAQKRDLIFHFEAGLAVCFAPVIAVALGVLHITPYIF